LLLNRRLGEQLRALADKAWARDSRDLATDLHNAARVAERERNEYGSQSEQPTQGQEQRAQRKRLGLRA
jgi:hypothetical protein